MPVVHAVRMAHMDCGEVVYTRHALMRMFERAVTTADVREILLTGELVEDYPADEPFPSRLLLGRVREEALHVVVAVDAAAGRCHIITVYWPDVVVWLDDWRRRR